MSTPPAIQTTTVGSYPIPDWLQALPSEQALVDATRVVFDTQRQAGIVDTQRQAGTCPPTASCTASTSTTQTPTA